jgi:8-oxo-dGTP diphosphatase
VSAPLQPDRSYPARPILAVSTAVIRDGRILVAERANAPGAGLYSLPGGLVELGETLMEGAARELMEEVGVIASPVAICGHRDIIARDDANRIARHFVVVTFAARWISGEGTTGPEAAAIRWVTRDELGSLPTTEGLGEVVEAAFRMIGS